MWYNGFVQKLPHTTRLGRVLYAYVLFAMERRRKMTNLEKYLHQLRRIEEHREATSEKEIRKIYKSILKDLQNYLTQIYMSYGEDDALTYGVLAAAGMDARFLEEVERRINGITPQVSTEINKTVNDTYEACYNGMRTAVEKASGNRETLQQAFSTVKAVTPDIIKQAVNNPVSGLTLSDTLEKHRKDIIYDIKKNIGVGLMNGDRYTTMARRISDSLDGDYRKSIRIVRTEAHRVRESGYNDAATAINGALKNGKTGYVMAKTWKTMSDERVRPLRQKRKTYNHVEMDGVTIPQDELFELPSGAKCMCPGKTGVAGEDINCRCIVVYDLVKESELTKQDGTPYTDTVEHTGNQYKNVNDAFSKVNLNGIETEFKDEISDELLNLANKYPINTKSIVIKTNKTYKEFGHATSGIRGSKRKDGYYALSDHHIAYSKELHKNADASKKYHIATYKGRGSKLADSANAYKATIAHEYAHQIDTMYLYSKKPELYEFVKSYEQPKKVGVADVVKINEVNREIRSSNSLMSRVITRRMTKSLGITDTEMYSRIYENYGEYAASSASEFLAEAFTNMMNLEEDKKTDFMRLFEKIFNEEFDDVLR